MAWFHRRWRISTKKDKTRKNDEIIAREVRLIGEEGEQLGIMTPREALRVAENFGLDVVEIAPDAKPPVCKLIDYGRFQYELKKKQAESKRKQVVVQVKEVKFRPITDEHDFRFKLKHIERFLAEGNKTKVVIRFRGREIVHKDNGFAMCDKIVAELAEVSAVEQPPKMEGRQIVMILVAKKK